MSDNFKDRFVAKAESGGWPVKLLWDEVEGIVKVWFTDYPLVTVSIDIIPDDHPDYYEQVYAQNVLIMNLWDILMKIVEGDGVTKVTELGEAASSPTDEAIRKLMEGGFDA